MRNYSVQVVVRLCFYDILAAFNRTEKERALSLKYHLIKSLEEWVDDSQRAFPKVILEDTGIDISGKRINTTVSITTASPLSSTSPASTFSNSRETYDNAYFYILFVMVFYSFLAMTLFKCLGSDKENKDPYEEFIRTGQPSTQKFNTGHMAEKFYFEEESSL